MITVFIVHWIVMLLMVEVIIDYNDLEDVTIARWRLLYLLLGWVPLLVPAVYFLKTIVGLFKRARLHELFIRR